MFFVCFKPGANPRGDHMDHDPSFVAWGTTGLPGLIRGTTGLAGAPQNFQGTPHTCRGHHRPARSTTGLARTPVRGTTGLSGAAQACQGRHLSSRGTTGLPEESRSCQGHHSPFQGRQCATGLSGAPPAYQGHHMLINWLMMMMMTGLAGAPHT